MASGQDLRQVFHEVLEAAWAGDGEEPRWRVAGGGDGMGDAAWREDEVAHAGGELVVTNPHTHRSLQHVQVLVLPEVRVAGDVIGHHVLEEGEGAASVVAHGLEPRVGHRHTGRSTSAGGGPENRGRTHGG